MPLKQLDKESDTSPENVQRLMIQWLKDAAADRDLETFDVPSLEACKLSHMSELEKGEFVHSLQLGYKASLREAISRGIADA